MTEPRRHWALPAPTGPAPDDQPTLWSGSCPECGGSGRVQIPLDFDWAETDEIGCQACGGSGIEQPDAPP